MKKIISAVVAVMLSGEPMVISYDDNILTENINGCKFTYTVSADGNAVITGCESFEDEIIIPSSLGGYIVKYIGEKAFFGNIMTSSIIIPDSITYIGDNAFSGCLALENIKLPETLTHLGSGCFMSCSSLKNATLNSMLSAVPDNCFNACTSLESIDIPDSVVMIGTEAFFGCSDLSGTFIPPTVKIIGENALGMHYDLRSNGIERINNFRVRGLPGTQAEIYATETGLDFYCKMGDVNCDDMVDAVDSSRVLGEYALMSTTGESLFDSYQKYVGDYNADGFIDAVDGSLILIEYARLQTLQGEKEKG